MIWFVQPERDTAADRAMFWISMALVTLAVGVLAGEVISQLIA